MSNAIFFQNYDRFGCKLDNPIPLTEDAWYSMIDDYVEDIARIRTGMGASFEDVEEDLIDACKDCLYLEDLETELVKIRNMTMYLANLN